VPFSARAFNFYLSKNYYLDYHIFYFDILAIT